MLRLALLCVLFAGGCATGGDADPRDPFEPFNRRVYRLNEVVDENFARPVATAYRDLLPEAIRSRVRNFFANLGDVWIGANDFMQGKFEQGIDDWARFAFNSTFGLLGIHDVASDFGLEKRNEDFGQTLGHWGVGDGPYPVLPILSSSSVRDTAGWVVDFTLGDPVGEFRPIRVRNSAYAVRLVNTRAELLDASRILEQAALDKYVFQRDAYLQRRRNLVHDGSPPREPREPREREEEPEKDATQEPGKPQPPPGR